LPVLKKQLPPDKNSGSNRTERLRDASQQRRNQLKTEVRQAILDAASVLFVEQGYQSFSLRQVAERIGYSPGTIYLYFKDKDDILITIMNEGIARFSQTLMEAGTVPDIRQRLGVIGRAYVNFGLHNPAHYQLMFVQRTDYLERTGNESPQVLFQILALWQAVIEEAMKAGILRLGDPISTSDTLFAMLHGVVCVAILMPRFDEKRINEMIDTTLEMLTNGLHRT
jgi:AcrR family transcriptional regulator